MTLATHALSLSAGIATSVILARALGPEGRGIYALAMLLPSLVVTLGNLGIGAASVYYVARGGFRRQEILGNNVLLSLGISGLGILVGLAVVVFVRESVFPGVPARFLLIALALIPAEIFFSFVRYVLLGAQRIKEFNYVQIVQLGIFLGAIAAALLGLRAGVMGAISAALLTWMLVDLLVYYQARKAAGGVDLRPSPIYVRKAVAYGSKVYLANSLSFLSYRLGMFLVGAFLGPAAVGLYAVGVGLAEKLWMLSDAASTVLFPRVAAETEEERRKEFTPLVARTVLWSTALAAVVLALVSRWIVLLLYSEAFLPAVSALQALLTGIVVLSPGAAVSSDIAGRGFPHVSIYVGLAAAVTNVVLNILWIPRYGIVGASWASTASYTVEFLVVLFFYCRLSGNRWTAVVLPQRGDWALYWRTGVTLWQWARAKVRAVI